MTIRIKHTVVPRIWDDTDQKDVLFAPDLSNNEITIDTFTRVNSGKFSIPTGNTENIPFGDVTVVKGYFIELQPVSATEALPTATLNINGLGAIPFEPAVTSKPAKTFHEGGTITSLAVNNTGATVLEGRWAVWGDDT